MIWVSDVPDHVLQEDIRDLIINLPAKYGAYQIPLRKVWFYVHDCFTFRKSYADAGGYGEDMLRFNNIFCSVLDRMIREESLLKIVGFEPIMTESSMYIDVLLLFDRDKVPARPRKNPEI